MFMKIKSPLLVLLHAERWTDTHGEIHRQIFVIFGYENIENKHAIILCNAMQYRTRLTKMLAHN